jgi:hypothetical protein
MEVDLGLRIIWLRKPIVPLLYLKYFCKLLRPGVAYARSRLSAAPQHRAFNRLLQATPCPLL